MRAVGEPAAGRAWPAAAAKAQGEGDAGMSQECFQELCSRRASTKMPFVSPIRLIERRRGAQKGVWNAYPSMAPPLGVGDVAIERAPVCAPLHSVGVTPRPRSYGDIRLPMGRRASSRFAGCATLLPSLEEPIGPPEFPTLPW